MVNLPVYGEQNEPSAIFVACYIVYDGLFKRL